MTTPRRKRFRAASSGKIHRYAHQRHTRVQESGRGLSQGARTQRAPRLPARNAAHHPEAQGHGSPAGGHQDPHQAADRRTFRPEEGRPPQRTDARGASGRGRAALPHRATERGQVQSPCAAHGITHGCRPLPLHHAPPGAGNAALRGHLLPARGPSAGVCGLHGTLVDQRATTRRRRIARDRR